MCGADLPGPSGAERRVGSSPRVRSGRRVGHDHRHPAGIISACAERTTGPDMKIGPLGDHLRVCGADLVVPPRVRSTAGSSPRVRSGQQQRSRVWLHTGIISACAERTHCAPARRISCRDHLRVCGADSSQRLAHHVHEGSSPRVRSGHRDGVGVERQRGIISACAERTDCSASTRRAGWDHLRVCGADTPIRYDNADYGGSSPRVRSGPGVF